jgi:hypothetical protein
MKLGSHIKGRIYTGVFEDKVLRRIFTRKSEEVTGVQRKFYNKTFIISIL